MSITDIPPVDRGRRYRFVLFVTVFCLTASAVFTGLVAFGLVSSIFLSTVTAFIESMNGIATAVILAYIGGSVVDYSVGLPKMMQSKLDSEAASGEAKG